MFRAWKTLLHNAHCIIVYGWNNQRTYPYEACRKWYSNSKNQQRLHSLKYFAIILMSGVCKVKEEPNVTPKTPNLLSKLMKYFQVNADEGKNDKKPKTENVANLYRSDQRSHHRKSFRDIKIREYENRLRVHSRPEKIFRYFATIKTKNSAGHWEVYMTPIDFLRSMLPGFRQPDRLGLDRYRKMDREKARHLSFKDVDKDSIFYTLRSDGLLTFGDYLYLLMLMSLPERYFRIGFSLFDEQGTEQLSRQDMNLLLMGISGDEYFKNHTSVSYYFFGPQLNEKLSLEKFLQFKRKLYQDVLMLEFKLLQKKHKNHKHKRENTISELCFAKVLLTYATIPTCHKVEILERINNKYRKSKSGITLDEFMMFFKFIENLSDIDMALTFHYLAGADISRKTLKHISDVVVGVSLSEHLVDIIFTIFDTDNNGIIGRNEFIQALRFRMSRLQQQSATKLSDLFGIVLKCAKETLIV